MIVDFFSMKINKSIKIGNIDNHHLVAILAEINGKSDSRKRIRVFWLDPDPVFVKEGAKVRIP